MELKVPFSIFLVYTYKVYCFFCYSNGNPIRPCVNWTYAYINWIKNASIGIITRVSEHQRSRTSCMNFVWLEWWQMEMELQLQLQCINLSFRFREAATDINVLTLLHFANCNIRAHIIYRHSFESIWQYYCCRIELILLHSSFTPLTRTVFASNSTCYRLEFFSIQNRTFNVYRSQSHYYHRRAFHFKPNNPFHHRLLKKYNASNVALLHSFCVRLFFCCSYKIIVFGQFLL